MKKFKYSKVIAMVLLVLMLLGMTGCGSTKPAPTPAAPSVAAPTGAPAAPTKASAKPVQLVWATDSVGSSQYTIVSAMATVLKGYLPAGSSIDVQPISPGGMGAPYLFENKTADISFANGAPAKAAWNEGVLGKPKTQGYRAIVGHLTNVAAVTYFSTAFVKKHGVTTLEEVVAKKIPIRVGTSPKGSMDEWCTSLVFKHFGLTYDDVKKWGGNVIQAGGAQLSDMLKDGKIDMIMNHTSAQSSDVTQDSMTVDVTFVQFGEELLKFFEGQGFQRIKYNKGIWKGMDKDVIWPGTPDCIFVSKDMPDEIAYGLVKGISENKDQFVKQFSSLTPYDPKTAWKPETVGGVPLHPGAEKYYKEVGYMK